MGRHRGRYPPISDAPLFARCRGCTRPFRGRADLTVEGRQVVDCPWCGRPTSIDLA